MRFNLDKISIAVFFIFLGALWPVFAEENFILTIKDHRFSPEEMKIPASKKVKITVQNNDASPEEFESYELRREKVVNGHSSITLYIGPLKPGSYKYFGDFNPKTAQGRLIVEEKS